jgi:hypothetical protein
VAEFDISNITHRMGNKLYYTQEKSFIEVDINDLIDHAATNKEVIIN